MKDKKENVKICPKCGGININPHSEVGLYQGEYFLEQCGDCLYISSYFPKVEKSGIKEFRKKLKQQK